MYDALLAHFLRDGSVANLMTMTPMMILTTLLMASGSWLDATTSPRGSGDGSLVVLRIHWYERRCLNEDDCCCCCGRCCCLTLSHWSALLQTIEIPVFEADMPPIAFVICPDSQRKNVLKLYPEIVRRQSAAEWHTDHSLGPPLPPS